MNLGELLQEEPATARQAVLEDELAEYDGPPGVPVEDSHESWLATMYPDQVTAPMATHHTELWEWGEGVEGPEDEPEDIVAVLARGGGKSSTAELLAAYLGLRGRRLYVWYVRGTQDNANDSLANIQSLLEAETVERHYPEHARREVTQYGHSKGWKSDRLRTAGRLVIDAIGLDTAARGLKVEEKRPDLIILDDLDEKHDTKEATAKKIATLTTSVLPAGTERTAVLAIQNLIIPNGVFTRMTDGRADYLVTARIIGPVPAVVGMKTDVEEGTHGRKRAVITEGTPTWAGQPIAACQRLMDRIGLRAFKQEAQHEVKEREGALWKLADIGYNSDVPELVRVGVGVDPPGGGTEVGIIAAGLGVDGRVYVLADGTMAGGTKPLQWGAGVLAIYDLVEAGRILAEANYGGDMVKSNIEVAARDAGRKVAVRMVRATRGKQVRAEPVAALYEAGMVDHVAPFPELEGELTQWVPGDKQSPNRLDALVWVITWLALKPGADLKGGWWPGMDEELGNMEAEAA